MLGYNYDIAIYNRCKLQIKPGRPGKEHVEGSKPRFPEGLLFSILQLAVNFTCRVVFLTNHWMGIFLEYA
jgi:hypothetical protein